MNTEEKDNKTPQLIDFHPPRSDIRADVIHGLGLTQKQLPPKYFYDQKGSTIFEEITQLEEYYLTRTEAEIMSKHLPEIAELIGPQAAVIEFGSGTGEKIRRLLSYLSHPVAAVTVEISREHLKVAAQRQAEQFPGLEIIAVCADFMRSFELPPIDGAHRHLVFFPGSTIGNFTPTEARRLLGIMRSVAGSTGAILLGIDLVKDSQVLEAAYNDALGVTAKFNLNLLYRINNELGADFNINAFSHQADYNVVQQRIEMYLVSQEAQTVKVGQTSFDFVEGERILTEYSHKYDISGFSKLAESASLEPVHVWTDHGNRFAVVLLRSIPK